MNSSRPLTLFVNPAWRRDWPHTALLSPWWGNPFGTSSFFTKQAFDTFALDTRQYSMTADIETADFVLAPYPYLWYARHDPDAFKKCHQVARKRGIPLLVDAASDIEEPITFDHVVKLRYGGYRFLPERGRIEIPLFTDDLLERCRGGKLSLRRKREGKPVVGFAGWAALSPKQRLRAWMRELPTHLHAISDSRYRACTKGIFWREKAIHLLESSAQVTFNGYTRKSFSGTSKTAETDMQTLRQQMVDTILESDYALDVRGDANNSARLFEILSLGRIPVILDTERLFPFSDKIDYASFALIVDYQDIEQLPDIIAAFHKTVLPERFEEMQRSARRAYLEYFRIDAVMRPLVEELRAQLSSVM